MRKILTLFSTFFILISLISVMSSQAYAACSVSMGGPSGTQGQGSTFNVTLSLSAADEFIFSADISADSGLSVTAVTVDGSSSGTGTVATLSNSSSHTVVITVTASGDGGDKHVYASNIKIGYMSGSANETTSASCTVHIQTNEEIAAAKAAQEEADRIAAAIASSEAAAQQKKAEEEAAYNASVAASAQAVEESRRASEAYESSVAASLNEATREEAEAASRSAAESESESLSIEEESRAAEEESRSIEESESVDAVKASRQASIEESLEDKTRAYDVAGTVYIPYTYASHGKFLFASADTDYTDDALDGFTRTELTINCQSALAWTCEGMSDDTYVILGTYSESSDPRLYYYCASDDSLIPFENIPQSFTAVKGNTGSSRLKTALFTGIAFILGLAAALVAIRIQQKAGSSDDMTVTREGFSEDISPEDNAASGSEDSGIVIPEETEAAVLTAGHEDIEEMLSAADMPEEVKNADDTDISGNDAQPTEFEDSEIKIED